MPTNDYDPMGARARRARRRQRLGRNARCIRCGNLDPIQLMVVKQSYFEEHHVLGQAHVPDLTTTVCRNCHATLSAAQVNDGVPLVSQQTFLERLIAVVAALASLLRELGESLFAWVDKSGAFVNGLDLQYPEWRVQPWAA